MTPDAALAHLETLGDETKAAQMAATHKVKRRYLGIATPSLHALAKEWRGDDLAMRLALAAGLWNSDIHDARLCAAKLLTQARLRPDDSAVWDLIASWVPELDDVALADAVCMAAQKRVVWDPARLDEVERWTTSEHMWTRRAALVTTLPWAKLSDPKPTDEAIRERVLGWAAFLAADKDITLQKAIAWWLRDLSKHDVPLVQVFLEEHGALMNKAARKEAAARL